MRKFKKLADNKELKRSYGFQNEWGSANPKCLQELCMTTTGLVGFPENPINCTDDQMERMKGPPVENISDDDEDYEYEFERQSGGSTCACNCKCNTGE